MSNMPTIWTEELIRRLTELVEDGLSRREIANKLSDETGRRITRNACIAKCNRLGLGDKRTERQREIAYKRREQRRATASNSTRATRATPPRGGGNTGKSKGYLASNTNATGRATATTGSIAARVAHVPPVEPRHVALLELEQHQCRWPYGDGPYTFCGHDALPVSSYCEYHTRVAARDEIIAERAVLKAREVAHARRDRELA